MGTTSSPAAPYTANSSDPWAPYIMQTVYNELTATTAQGGDNVPVREVGTGGLRVVTTISYPMEKALYKAVDANIAAIKATPGAQFPSYIRIGAELQDPSNGGIIAMYPGPGQDMSAKQCKQWDCQLNTAVATREQAGSSFTPFVLAAAVADGMNVQTSTLNSSAYLCVPPDAQAMVLLTINEQATMLSAIADNGVYHQSHIVKYWQQPNGRQRLPVIASHGVLDPSNPAVNAQLDSQVQYAMEMTTVDGTGTYAAHGLGSRQVIAKTGTTAGHHSGFFIGAIPQYALAVGMFAINQAANSPNNLSELGGGSDGYWPAKIWNTFAQEEFASLPEANFQSPVFTGANWNQVG